MGENVLSENGSKTFCTKKKFFLKTLFLVVFEFLKILRERLSPWALRFTKPKITNKTRHKIVAVFVAFLVSSLSFFVSSSCFSLFPAVSWHPGTPRQPTKRGGYRRIFPAFGGFAKGWFPKGWFWRMFPRNENRNEGTFAKTTLLETALLSPNDPFWWLTKGWFPKGWFRRMFPRNENRNEGTFAKTALLRNRPFISQWAFLGGKR